MKRNLLLYILLAFLLIVNGFFLYNHLSKPNRKAPEGPGNFIVNELQFNNDQLERFNLVEDAHHEKMRELTREVRQLKDELFNRIPISSVNSQDIDSISTLLGNLEKEKEVEIFEYLRSIQEICDDTQKEKFKMIIKDALRRGDRKGRRPPGLRRPNDRRPPPPPPNIDNFK